mgnify:CR=1 FL=1
MTERRIYRIDVKARTTYLPDQSDEAESRYVFAYTITITNTGAVDAQNVVFSDTPGANTTLVVGSVITSGTVVSGNTAGNTSVTVAVGTIPGAGGSVTITFRVTINSPETEQALVAFKAWFEAASDPECLSWDDSSNNRAFLAEQVWATLNGASIYVAALKDRPELAQDIQHALLPRGPKGQFILAYPIAFAIPSYVKDPTPAKELLSYLLDPKVYGEFMKQGKGYTQAPYKKGEDELWPSTDPKFDPYKQIGNLSRWYGYPAPPSPQAAESGSKYIVVDMFAKVAQGESPQSAMQWAEAELKKIFGA